MAGLRTLCSPACHGVVSQEPLAIHAHPQAWNACRGGHLHAPPTTSFFGCCLPMFAIALSCALWDRNPCYISCYIGCTNPAGPPISPSCWVVCAHLVLLNQIATPCRFNDLVQEHDNTKQERDRTREELRASNERHMMQSEQLGAARDNLRAAERARDYLQAQMQQVGLPLCNAGQCWAGRIVVAS